MAAAACGDDGGNNTRADAAVGDDGQVDAAPTTPVTLTVKLDGAAVAGVRVHFQNPDSSVITSVDTDATGTASAMMPEGGFVTAVDPFTGAPGVGTRHDLYTYSNVEPGDALEMSENGSPASAGTVTVNAATDSDVNVDGYVFWSPCDTSGIVASPSYTMSLQSNCTPTTDILVASVDAAGEILHWVFAPNVTTTATVNLTGMAFTSTPVDRTYTYNNLLQFGETIGSLNLYSAAGRIVDASFSDVLITTLSEPYKLPLFTNAFEVAHVQDESEFGYHLLADWAPLAAGDLTLDTATRRLRNATTGTSFDATMKRGTWTEDATGAVADVAVGDLQISRNSGSVRIYWNLLVPNTAGQIQYPTLPVEATDYNPGVGDVTDIVVRQGKVPGGFASVRERFFTFGSLSAILGSPATLTALSSSGHLEIQEIFPGPGGLQRRTKSGAPKRPSWNQRRR